MLRFYVVFWGGLVQLESTLPELAAASANSSPLTNIYLWSAGGLALSLMFGGMLHAYTTRFVGKAEMAKGGAALRLTCYGMWGGTREKMCDVSELVFTPRACPPRGAQSSSTTAVDEAPVFTPRTQAAISTAQSGFTPRTQARV